MKPQIIDDIQGHSPEPLPRHCKPDSGVVLDPALLERIKPESLPHDFAMLLEEQHMPWVPHRSRDLRWLKQKTELKLNGYAVVEWQDNASRNYYARCTRQPLMPIE